VLRYVAKRVMFMVPTLVAISVVAFILIQLPPGDFVTSLAASASSSGNSVDPATLEQLRHDYGLDQPIWVQYWIWISKIVFHGDFGRSFDWKAPVSDLLWGRLGLTFVLSFTALVTTWIIAFPIGIYSAVRKYSIGDYIATFLSFVGLAIPNFVLALVLMYVSLRFFNMSVGGLFSPQFQDAPWSAAKAYDLAQHMIIPVIVLSGSGIASLVRIMRANLLDELYRPYVITARAKGLPEWWLTLKYPVRAALNPFVSTIGWALPELVSGGTVTAIVLNLPTTGPLLLRALISQDIYLAGSMIMMLSVLTVLGTLISDLLLAWLDPRIRYR
jgi:peptide/nickel transport system permease protein